MLRTVLRRYRAAFSGLPGDVWLLALAMFVNRSGSMVLAFLTLYLTSQLDMGEGTAGRMLGVYGLGGICGAYLGGRLAERVGAVRLQTICLLLSVPGLLVLPFLRDGFFIATTLFAVGLVSDAVRPANAAAITKLTNPGNRTRAFALQRLAVNLGLSCGPAAGGVLALVHYGLLFVVDAVTTGVAACVLAYCFWGRDLAARRVAPDGQPTRSPLGDTHYVVFLGLLLLTGLVFFQVGSTYPLYLRDHYGFGPPMVGLMFAVNTVVIVLFEMVLIDYVGNWSRLRTIGLGTLLIGLGFGVLPLGGSLTFCVFAMLVLTSGEMLSMPMSAVVAANRSGPGAEGSYMGWYSVTFAVATVLAPVVGAAVYEVNPEALWGGCLLLSAGLMAAFGMLGVYERRSR